MTTKPLAVTPDVIDALSGSVHYPSGGYAPQCWHLGRPALQAYQEMGSVGLSIAQTYVEDLVTCPECCDYLARRKATA